MTSYIDGSMVYGSSDDEVRRLRQFEGGRLKVTDGHLPTTDDEAGCIRERSDVKCFQSGKATATLCWKFLIRTMKSKTDM